MAARSFALNSLCPSGQSGLWMGRIAAPQIRSGDSLPAPVLALSAAIAAIFLRLGFIDCQRPAVEFPTVKTGDSLVALAVIGHLHECEASGLSSVPVRYDVYAADRAVRLKQNSNRVFRCSEAEVSYKYIFHVKIFFLNLQNSESKD